MAEVTWRSLVQIQPAQRKKEQVRSLMGGSSKRGAANFCPNFAQVLPEKPVLPPVCGPDELPIPARAKTSVGDRPTRQGAGCAGHQRGRYSFAGVALVATMDSFPISMVRVKPPTPR
jgi:hypothetical protein